MGLSATLITAQSSLATNAALSGIVGRNIAGVNDPNYSRKIGEVITNGSGGATLVGVGRAADAAVFTALLSANADAASSKAVSDGLDRLEDTVSLTNTAVSQDNASPRWPARCRTTPPRRARRRADRRSSPPPRRWPPI